MALQKQIVPILFQGGLDTKTDPKLVQVGKTLKLENATYDETGALNKRFGFDSLGKGIAGGATEVSSGVKITTRNDELVLISDNNIYTYAEATDSWYDKGTIAGVPGSAFSLSRDTQDQLNPDCDENGGVLLFAWESSAGDIVMTALDSTTKSVVLPETIVTTGHGPKVIAAGSYIYIYYIDTATGDLYRAAFNPSTLSYSLAEVATDIYLAAAGNAPFDIVRHGNNMAIAYIISTGAKVGYLKASTGLIASVTDGLPVPITDIDIAELGEANTNAGIGIVSRFRADGGDRLWIMFDDVDAFQRNKCICIKNDLSGTFGSSNDSGAGGSTVFGGCLVELGYDSEALWLHHNSTANFMYLARSSNLGSLSVQDTFFDVLPLTKPFVASDGQAYFCGVYTSNSGVQDTTYLFKLQVYGSSQYYPQVVNVIERNTGSAIRRDKCHMANVVQLASNPDKLIVTYTVKSEYTSESSTDYFIEGINFIELDLAPESRYQSVEMSGNLFLAAGNLWQFDGSRRFETGYNFFPEITTAGPNGSGGSLSAGNYQYIAMYEWKDTNGNIHRSAPSLPTTVTTVSSDSVDLECTVNNLSEKMAEVNNYPEISLVFYRTEVNGTVFYRATSLTAPTIQQPFSAFHPSITDTISDATLVTKEILYTTGGVLDNIGPENASAVASYKNRLVCNSNDRDKIQYSKEKLPGVGVEFNDALNLRVDQGKGGIRSFLEMDEKLIIFKKDSIYVVVGDGPDNLGNNNDFRQPQLVTTDAGCDKPQTVVLTPRGIMFLSDKGFLILNRSLQVEDVGDPVDDFNSLSYTSAVLVNDEDHVRFTTREGRILVYDYGEDKWTTFTNLTAESSTMWRDKYVLLKDDGTVLVQNNSKFKDGDLSYPLKVSTAWIKTANLMGAQRIYKGLLLLDRKDDHRLRIKVYYDFDDTAREIFTFDTKDVLKTNYFGEGSYYGEDSPYGGDVDSKYHVEFKPAIQKCTSIRFEIEDLNPEGTENQGFSLTGLALEVGVKKGTHRLSTSTKRMVGTN